MRFGAKLMRSMNQTVKGSNLALTENFPRLLLAKLGYTKYCLSWVSGGIFQEAVLVGEGKRLFIKQNC